MGLGPFSSSSETKSKFSYSDSRNAAADQATLIDNRASGKNSRLNAVNAAGSIAVSGNNNYVSYEFTDAGAFDLVGAVVHETVGALGASQAATFDAISQVNDQLAALSETKLTDGANLNQKTTIVALVVFGVIGLVAWLFLKR